MLNSAQAKAYHPRTAVRMKERDNMTEHTG